MTMSIDARLRQVSFIAGLMCSLCVVIVVFLYLVSWVLGLLATPMAVYIFGFYTLTIRDLMRQVEDGRSR
jgi:hypothetical protein